MCDTSDLIHKIDSSCDTSKLIQKIDSSCLVDDTNIDVHMSLSCFEDPNDYAPNDDPDDIFKEEILLKVMN